MPNSLKPLAVASPFAAAEPDNDEISGKPFVVLSMSDRAAGALLHVDIGRPRGGDGLSWATAFNTIDAALDAANALELELVEVRVAQGTYVPTNPPLLVGVAADRQVVLRGGFPGADAADPDAQDIAGNPTAISGDVLGDDAPGFVNREDNIGVLIDGFGTLEGLIVSGGYGTTDGSEGTDTFEFFVDNGPSPVVFRGLIQQCLFMENQGVRGGAVRSNNLLIVSSDFINNRGIWAGGAVYGGDPVSGANPSNSKIRVVASLFTGNRAPNGGAMWSVNNSGIEPGVVAHNSVFSGNRASGGPAQNFGGAIGAYSRAWISNCTFVDNSVDVGQGGAVFILNNINATVANSLFADNEAGGIPDHVFCQNNIVLSHCLFGDDSPKRVATLQLLPELIGEPRFIDRYGLDGVAGTGDENLRLAAGSPAIDAGTAVSPPLPPELLETDFDGLPRVFDDPVAVAVTSLPIDIGAYEYQYDCDGNGIVDSLDIATGTLADCNDDGVPDICQSSDCNGSGILDICEIYLGMETDCNNNGIPDSCELASGALVDANGSGIPDVCELLVLRVANTDAGWDDAIGELQDALDLANARAFGPTDIWVAAGTYTPDRGTLDRGQSFKIRSGVRLLGGFAGHETEESQRDVVGNPTILSGDLRGDDHDAEGSRDDNALRVVHLLGNGLKGPAVLDGFTVTGGYTIGPFAFIVYLAYQLSPMYSFGAGVYASGSDLYIANSTVTGNTARLKGNAIFLEGWSELEIRNSEISHNHWESTNGLRFGGGIASHGELTVFDSVIAHNGNASTRNWLQGAFNLGEYGGGIAAYGPTLLVNTKIHANKAFVAGGGISIPKILNGAYFDDLTGPVASMLGRRLTAINSEFTMNVSGIGLNSKGVAIDHRASGMKLINCLVASNISLKGITPKFFSQQPTIYVPPTSEGSPSDPENLSFVTNTTITGNIRQLLLPAAVLGRARLDNSIVWGNGPQDMPEVVPWSTQVILVGSEGYMPRHNTVQGLQFSSLFSDPSNNSFDPLFIDPVGPDGIRGTGDEDFRLRAASPLLDRADVSLLPADLFDLNNNGDTREPIPFDLDGNPRVVDLPGLVNDPTALDRGAYERQVVPGCPADLDANGVVDADDLGILLAAFGEYEPNLAADLDGNGVVDADDLWILLASFGQVCR